MATLGQVVYNLEDYHASGGLISTNKNNRSSVIVSSQTDYYSNRINIYSNIFSGISNIRKVGIQAPPGTKVNLNNGRIILIGRSGVFELDSEVPITSLVFIPQQNFKLDTTATETSLQEAALQMEEADRIRTRQLHDLSAEYLAQDKDARYWELYTQIQNTYINSYNAAYPKYVEGINGVYILDTANPNKELYNIIVDYLY